MITVISPLGNLEIRADRPEVQHAVSRNVIVTPAGVTVVVGDGGWDPATMRLTVRVADPDAADAVVAWRALRSRALTATALQLHDSVVDVLGLVSIDSRMRGTWWQVELLFLPAVLVGARNPGATFEPTLDWLLIGPETYLEIAPDTALLWRDS